MNARVLISLAGLAVGLLLGFVLPAHWLFVDAHKAHAKSTEGEAYACPMFCIVTRVMPEDGKCPVCGMQLTVVSDRSTLTEAERGMVGLQTARLQRLTLKRTIRVVGEVDYDETRLSKITTRTAGWLNEVWADTKWMKVEEGQKLAELYSPELYSAQKEYLLAKGELRATAAQRLRLLGIGDAEIAALERADKVSDYLILRAPRAGVVAERHATKGAAVKKGETLYAIADLSHVWIQADVFESDLPFVSVGQKVRVEALGRKRPIIGTVAFIDPALDRHTRTARMRIEIRNNGLRIGQRVDAWIDTEVEGKPLTLPRTAVLATGERSIVYVLFTESMGKRDYDLDPSDLPNTVLYEMVVVRVGPAAEHDGHDYYPLLEGKLKAGMVIVTKGNLLLDSQAQLLGKPSLLFPEGSRSGAAGMHMGH